MACSLILIDCNVMTPECTNVDSNHIMPSGHWALPLHNQYYEFSKFNFCYIFIATYYESCMVRFPHILMIDHHHGPYRNVWIFELHVGEQEISFAIKS